MTDKSKNSPPSVGAFDDESDNTIVDAASKSGAPVKSLSSVRTADPLFLGDDDEDEDATEVLRLPQQNEKTETKKRAIPLDRASALLSDDIDEDQATMALPSLSNARANAAQMTDPHVTIPPSMDESEENRLYPPIRDLNKLPERSYGGPMPENTVSKPRVVRIEMTNPHAKVKPLAQTKTKAPTQSAQSHDDKAFGELRIDAPANAVVFIDGVEYPKGPVLLERLLRTKRMRVKVTCAGYLPWSAQLSLNGKRKSRVRPTLVKVRD